jgi:hypothetical protein
MGSRSVPYRRGFQTNTRRILHPILPHLFARLNFASMMRLMEGFVSLQFNHDVAESTELNEPRKK